MTNLHSRRAVLLIAALVLSGCVSLSEKRASPKVLHVLVAGSVQAAYDELRPQFEQQTGYRLKTEYGASMGTASHSIPSRLARGEPADLIIVARPAVNALVKQGRVIAGSEVDLAHALIGLAVPHGAPKPDIRTVEGLRQALLAAPSIAYSEGATGKYFENDLLKRLGTTAQVLPKSKRIVDVTVTHRVPVN